MDNPKPVPPDSVPGPVFPLTKRRKMSERASWRNLRSEIDDIGDDGAEILVFVCFDKHRGIVRGMLERVRDDIGEQLAQAVLIACHLDIVGHMHFDVMRMPGIGDFQRFHGFVKKIGEIEPFDLQLAAPASMRERSRRNAIRSDRRCV